MAKDNKLEKCSFYSAEKISFVCSKTEIYLFGGCVTSWKVPSGRDLLFVRPDAVFNGKKPIRFYTTYLSCVIHCICCVTCIYPIYLILSLQLLVYFLNSRTCMILYNLNKRCLDHGILHIVLNSWEALNIKVAIYYSLFISFNAASLYEVILVILCFTLHLF